MRIAVEVKTLNNIIEKIIDEVFSGDNNADGKILSDNLVIDNIFYKALRFLSVESRSGSDSEEDSEENISEHTLERSSGRYKNREIISNEPSSIINTDLSLIGPHGLQDERDATTTTV